MTSVAAFAIRNFTVFFAAILICSPVAGFRPMRSLRSAFTSLLRPGTVNSPASRVCSVAISASASMMTAASHVYSAQTSADYQVPPDLLDDRAKYPRLARPRVFISCYL